MVRLKNTTPARDVTGSRAIRRQCTKLVSGPKAGEHDYESYAWEIRPLCLDDMDDQVSHEDLVDQPMPSIRSPVCRLARSVRRQR